MSEAQRVPETYQLTGDDAVSTLRRVRWQHLLTEAFQRLRVSDGFSHARASAFTLALLLVEALPGWREMMLGLLDKVKKNLGTSEAI